MAKKEVIIRASSLVRFWGHFGVLPGLILLLPFLVYHWLPPALGGLGDIEQTFFGFAFFIFALAILSPIASYFLCWPDLLPKIIITERELVFLLDLFSTGHIPLNSISDAYVEVDEHDKNKKHLFALSPRQQIVLVILLGWFVIKKLFLRKQKLVVRAIGGERLAELDLSDFDNKGIEQLKATLQERIPRQVWTGEEAAAPTASGCV